MNKEENKPQFEFADASLDFKLHQDFFELLFQYIKDYENAMADTYTDAKAGIKAFKELTKLISFTSPHISHKADIKEIKAKRDAIHEQLKKNKPVDARNKLEELAEHIFSIFESAELIPKIKKQEEDENAKFWKEEEHKGLREIKKGFYDILISE